MFPMHTVQTILEILPVLGRHINNNIEVTILEIRGDQIKLGISAPRDVSIYRKEVYLQIQEENKAALETNNAEALKNLF